MNEKKVEYMLVGGYVVAFYGYPRYTGDIDIWYNPTPENVKKLLELINEFGFGSLGLTNDDLLKTGSVIQFGYPPYRIDLLNELDAVTFDECYKNKNSITCEGLSVNIIALDDLIKNKKATGRTKDLLDLENLIS
ncbi:MAG: hypothetical protein V1779_12320 [bacterium]